METALLVSSITLWVFVLFNLLLTLALVKRINALPQAGRIQDTDMLTEGEKAPDFTLETLDGRKVTLADYVGSEVAMVFVSPGCGPCRDQMPILNELYSKAKHLGTELTIISLTNVAETQDYAAELNFTSPIFAAPRDTNKLAQEYKVPGTPSFYLLDSQGKIKAGGFFDSTWKNLVMSWEKAYQ